MQLAYIQAYETFLSVVKDDLSLSGTFEKLIKNWQVFLALSMWIDVRDGEEMAVLQLYVEMSKPVVMELVHVAEATWLQKRGVQMTLVYPAKKKKKKRGSIYCVGLKPVISSLLSVTSRLS